MSRFDQTPRIDGYLLVCLGENFIAAAPIDRLIGQCLLIGETLTIGVADKDRANLINEPAGSGVLSLEKTPTV